MRAYRVDDRALAILLTIAVASVLYYPMCALVAWLRRNDVVSEAVEAMQEAL